MNELKNRITEVLEKLSSSADKKRKFVVIIGVIGVFLILLSEINLPFNEKKNKSTATFEGNYSEYVDRLNDELTDILSGISGVGTCRVMITLKNTNEKVFAQNSENSFSDGSNSRNNEYVFYESENGDSPILLKENFPAIEGVAVVCSGGDVPAVKESIISCVCALFNIPANRVSVSKLSENR